MPVQRVIADRYELSTCLGRGGMGEVWEGYDRRLDRKIAVKLLRKDALPTTLDAAKLRKRFVRETRLTARVEHSGVPAVYDTGTCGDDLFLAMQLVRGQNLGAFLTQHAPVPLGWAVAVAAQIAGVLAAAHSCSLVHRDIKPSNTMVCPDGTVKLLDFGIAAALDPGITPLTALNESLGTPAYMPPEQVNGGATTPLSDLYALGCLLHEIVAGRPPFTGEVAFAVLHQQVNAAPAPLRGIRADTPEPVERLVLDLLAKRPEQRPAGAEEVYARLEPLLPAPSAQNSGELHDPTRPYRRPLAPVRRLEPATAADTLVLAPDEVATAAAPTALNEDRLRGEVDRLIEEQHYSKALDLLSDALRPERALAEDARLLFAHIRADTLFIAGDFRAALPEYQALLQHYTVGAGAVSEDALDCRHQIAACLVSLGETRAGIDVLREVYKDRFEPAGTAGAAEPLGARNPKDTRDTPAALALRQEIGRLLVAEGDHAWALDWNRALHSDALRVLGPDHRCTGEVADVLTHLADLGGNTP